MIDDTHCTYYRRSRQGKGVGRAPASILAWHGGMRHEPGVQSLRATRGQRTGLVYTARHSKSHKTNRSIDRRPPCVARKHASHIIKCRQRLLKMHIWMYYLTTGKQSCIYATVQNVLPEAQFTVHGVNWQLGNMQTESCDMLMLPQDCFRRMRPKETTKAPRHSEIIKPTAQARDSVSFREAAVSCAVKN